MKKIFLITFFMLLLNFSSFGQYGSYNEEAEQRETKKTVRYLVCGDFEHPIKVVGFMNYPPFGWKEMVEVSKKSAFLAMFPKKPVYHGLGMELFKRFAKEYDLQYQYVNVLNFNEAKYALSIGYFDILLGNYFDANSYSNINYFYPGYITNPIVIVTLKNEKEGVKIPENFDDLKGKKGLVRNEEYIYDIIYRQVPDDVKLEQVNGAKRAFQALLRKEVDFLLMSQFAYETEVRRYKIGNFLTYSKIPINTPVIFMSYAEGNACAAFIKDEFEKKLKEYVADENLMRSILSSEIITWENKFMQEESLIYQTEFAAEEEVEEADNLDEWLKQQKKITDERRRAEREILAEEQKFEEEQKAYEEERKANFVQPMN